MINNAECGKGYSRGYRQRTEHRQCKCGESQFAERAESRAIRTANGELYADGINRESGIQTAQIRKEGCLYDKGIDSIRST